MRGKELRCEIGMTQEGITPAYAGKSAFDTLHLEFTEGSPPPMRGKGTYMDETISIYRITPAYAGKRQQAARSAACTADHPRLCGEKRHCHFLYSSVIGSPPPMRGKGVS